jgi:hypothetical protein
MHFHHGLCAWYLRRYHMHSKFDHHYWLVELDRLVHDMKDRKAIAY